MHSASFSPTSTASLHTSGSVVYSEGMESYTRSIGRV